MNHSYELGALQAATKTLCWTIQSFLEAETEDLRDHIEKRLKQEHAEMLVHLKRLEKGEPSPHYDPTRYL